MLMKIGDVTAQLGISHRSLHYWESAGILQSTRAENDYRYYDEENLLKIKQIVLLRKLRMSIPSIQAIFTSDELSKVIAVFTDQLDETKRETAQLEALGVVLRQLLNMLKDRQDMDSVYKYLETTHTTESDELKAALQTVLSEPVKEITVESPPEPVVDMTGVDLSLVLATREDIPEVKSVIRQCFPNTQEDKQLLECWGFIGDEDFFGFGLPDCWWLYKIMQGGQCVGAVTLSYIGMEAMLIRCVACAEPDNNLYIFALLKQLHPDILCWNLYYPSDYENNPDHSCYDFEDKKSQFGEDNGFVFYTDARWDRHIKTLIPHDDIYNTSRYRFALLDGSMDGVSFRFFGVDKADFYDGRMTNWRVTDCYFGEALIYDTWMGNSRIFDTKFDESTFCHGRLSSSTFTGTAFTDCKLQNCDITGMTIDGVDVAEALACWREKHAT